MSCWRLVTPVTSSASSSASIRASWCLKRSEYTQSLASMELTRSTMRWTAAFRSPRYPLWARSSRLLEDQPLDVDASRSRHVLGEIAAAVRADLRASRPPARRLVPLAEERTLEDSLVDALD